MLCYVRFRRGRFRVILRDFPRVEAGTRTLDCGRVRWRPRRGLGNTLRGGLRFDRGGFLSGGPISTTQRTNLVTNLSRRHDPRGQPFNNRFAYSRLRFGLLDYSWDVLRFSWDRLGNTRLLNEHGSILTKGTERRDHGPQSNPQSRVWVRTQRQVPP